MEARENTCKFTDFEPKYQKHRKSLLNCEDIVKCHICKLFEKVIKCLYLAPISVKIIQINQNIFLPSKMKVKIYCLFYGHNYGFHMMGRRVTCPFDPRGSQLLQSFKQQH